MPAVWRALARVGTLLALVVGSGCLGADESEIAAAYVYIGDDRTVESVNPITMCNGWHKCDPSGFVSGLIRASTARDHARGGFGLRIEFDRSWTDAELAPVRAELARRAEALGLGRVEFIGADDEWPSCRGEPGCLTVNQSILP